MALDRKLIIFILLCAVFTRYLYTSKNRCSYLLPTILRILLLSTQIFSTFALLFHYPLPITS